MSHVSSQATEPLACERLGDDELQQVSGGVALVTGRQLQPSLAKVAPFGCTACVQGVPRDLLKNQLINPVLEAPLARF